MTRPPSKAWERPDATFFPGIFIILEDKPEVLDLAEFTALTPFPHTRAYKELKRQDRILTYDWNEYSADKVVFQPK